MNSTSTTNAAIQNANNAAQAVTTPATSGTVNGSLVQQFHDSLQTISQGFAQTAPALVVAIVIFIAGWVIAAVLGRVVDQIIKTLKIDNVLKNVGVEDLMGRAGFRLNSGAFLGGLVKWFIIIVFLVASLQIVGLTQVNDFLKVEVLGYLPNVIAAVLVLMIAAVIADVVQKIVTGGAKAAEVRSASFVGAVARWAIWIFAILVALSQLGIAQSFMQTLFTGVVAMLALAGGLAFGLGGRDAASRVIDRAMKELPHGHHE